MTASAPLSSLPLASEGTAVAPITGTITASTRKPATSLSGNVNEVGTVTASTKKPATSISGSVNEVGTISASTKKPATSVSGKVNEVGTITAGTKKPTANFTGTSIINNTGTIIAGTKKPTASINGTVPVAAPIGGPGDGETDPDIARAAVLNRTRRKKLQDKRKIRANKATPITPDVEPLIAEPVPTIGLDAFKDALAEQAAYEAMMADEDDVAAVLAMA